MFYSRNKIFEYEPIKKRKKKKKSNLVIIVLCSFIMVSLVIIGYYSYKTIIYFKEQFLNKKTNEEILNYIDIKYKDDINIDSNLEKDKEDINQKDTENILYKIDFDSLKQKNSDVVSFLKINNTNIKYAM